MSAIDPARSRDAPPERRGRLVVAATAMLCVSILAALALAEVVLRARHFEFLSVPKMQFGWPEPELIQHSFQTDPTSSG